MSRLLIRINPTITSVNILSWYVFGYTQTESLAEVECRSIRFEFKNANGVRSLQKNGSSHYSNAYDIKCPLCPVWMAPFLQVLFGDLICQKQSCVRPVSATHMAAGPDGFHQPIPIPHIEQQAFRTKLGVYWFLG